LLTPGPYRQRWGAWDICLLTLDITMHKVAELPSFTCSGTVYRFLFEALIAALVRMVWLSAISRALFSNSSPRLRFRQHFCGCFSHPSQCGAVVCQNLRSLLGEIGYPEWLADEVEAKLVALHGSTWMA